MTALVKLGAIGLVTTHDLALTELPSKLGAVAINTHFEDRLEDGKMVFDYTMRPGVVEHSNALALMRASGWMCRRDLREASPPSGADVNGRPEGLRRYR